MTIDELARRAGTTSRNIRNYQTLGLLGPPALAGRTGYYDEGHLARLRLVARLQEQGFSLAGIGQLIQAWESGRSLADVLGFEQVLTAPWSDEEPAVMAAGELLELFPQVLAQPELAPRAAALGLVEPFEGGFRVPSPSLLRAGAELAAVGVPLAATQDELEQLHADMDRVAARFVEMFVRYVWEPFVQAGMPAEDLPRVTDALRRMRPLAAVSVQAVLAQAMERQTAASTAGGVIQMSSATEEEAAS